jgi:hypothetical protein
MPAGRTPEVAARNAEMKAMRRGDLSYGRPLPARFVAAYFGISEQKTHVILKDPNSDKATAQNHRAKVVVDLLLDHEDDGISHGSESGYRRCRARPEGSCVDCRDAHAATIAAYKERKKAREAQASRRRRR